MSTQNECIICFEDVLSSPQRALECAHTFHASCINTWLEKKATCPVCRYRVVGAPTLGSDENDSEEFPDITTPQGRALRFMFEEMMDREGDDHSDQMMQQMVQDLFRLQVGGSQHRSRHDFHFHSIDDSDYSESSESYDDNDYYGGASTASSSEDEEGEEVYLCPLDSCSRVFLTEDYKNSTTAAHARDQHAHSAHQRVVLTCPAPSCPDIFPVSEYGTMNHVSIYIYANIHTYSSSLSPHLISIFYYVLHGYNFTNNFWWVVYRLYPCVSASSTRSHGQQSRQVSGLSERVQ